MYQTVSNTFKNIVSRTSRTFRAKMVCGTDELSAEIKKFSLELGSCGGDAFTIGCTYAGLLEVTLSDTSVLLAGREFQLFIGLLLDNKTVEHVPMGYYTVDPASVSKVRDQITAKAIDRISSKCSGQYIPSVTFPATISAVIGDISVQTGLTIVTTDFTSSVLSGNIEEPMDGLTYRETLGYLAGLLGGFCYADRTGRIVITKYTRTVTAEVAAERCFQDPEVAENDYTVNGLTVMVKEGGTDADGEDVEGISYQDGDGISVSNPYMTQAMFTAAAAAVKGYSFRPGTVSFLGDPRMDPTDLLQVTDASGNIYQMPCMSLTFSYDGGLTTSVTVPGEAESDVSGGPLSQQVEKLVIEMILAKEVIAKKISADEANLKFATIEKANILEANISKVSGDLASFKTGEFAELKSKEANFETATAENFTAVNANISKVSGDLATFKSGDFADLKAKQASFETATSENFTAVNADISKLSGDFASFKSGEFESLRAKESEFESATANNFTAVNASISKVSGDLASFQSGEFADLKAKQASFETATTNNFTAVNGEISTLSGDFASFKTGEFASLQAKEASFETATADNFTAVNADISSLQAKDAELNKAIIQKASITDLEAVNTRTGTLETNVADIQTLINGNLTSANIQSLTLTAANTTIENGMIKNAMIDTLAFSKITGVDINTTKLTVHSNDGKSAWTDNTIQISDTSRVRVQMGKDASGDYTLAVWDASGKLIWDALGATENTIQRKIIRDAVVADDAAIAGSKLDIESVVQEVNGATTKLKSTTILLDDKNQTLDVAFNSMESTMVSNLTEAKTYADAKASGALSDAKSYADTKASSTLSSAQQYALNQANSALASAKTYAEGQASTALSDAKSYADSGIAGIKVGGRNLARNTSDEWSAWWTPTANSVNICTYPSSAYLSDKKSAGDEYTVSVEIEFSGVAAGTGGNFKLYAQGSVDNKWRGVTNIWGSGGRPVSLSTPPSDGIYRYTGVSTLASNVVNATKFDIGFRADYWDGNGKMRWRKIKVEKGNRATDWSPAPEDTEAEITNLTKITTTHTTQISTMQGQISSLIAEDTTIKGNYDALVSRYNSTVATVDSMQTTIGEHTTLLDSQSQEILAVQAQANTIESDLSGTKQTVSSVQSSLNSTIIRVSTVETGLDGLKTRVSAAESTLSTKADGSTVDSLTSRVATCESTLTGFETSLTATNAAISTHTEQISSHDTRITAVENAITLKVSTSDYESYKTTVTGQIATAKSEAISAAASDATTKANNAQSAAISAASSDATTKANNALSDAKTYTNAQITTVNEHLTTTDQTISVMQGQIALKVEQTDIDTAVESIEVGGRNLLLCTKEFTTGTNRCGTSNLTGEYYHDTAIRYLDSSSISNSYTEFFTWQRITGISLEPGVTYCASFWAKGTGKIKIHLYGTSGYLKCAEELTSQGVTAVTGDGNIDISLSDEWERIWIKFTMSETPGTDGATNHFLLRLYKGNIAYIAGVKFEKGNKPTDWSPAPEDIDASITAVDAKFASYSTTTQMQSAITAAKDSITQSVSETYATKTALSTAEGNISSLTTRVSTAESKLTKDSLVTTIGSYYSTQTYTDTELSKKKDTIYHTCDSSGGTSGYFHVARCVVKSTYANQPITMTIANRAKQNSSMTLVFANANSTDPLIQLFQKTGNANFYIYKSETSTWDLYVQKSESYDSLAVTDFSMGSYSSKFTWTWCDETITSAISGWKSATQLAAMYSVDTTSGGTSGSNSLITSGAVYSKTQSIQTIATQTSEKFNWLVQSGTSATDFTLTDRTATLVADAINLQGLVTFSGLDTAAQNTIQGYSTDALVAAKSYAESQASTAKSEAISAASSDATTKANNALSDAKSYTDSGIAGIEVGSRNLITASTLRYTSLPSTANFILHTVNNISSSALTTDGLHYTATESNGATNSSRGIKISLTTFGLSIGDTIAISYDCKGVFGSSNNGLTVMHATDAKPDTFHAYIKTKINGSSHPKNGYSDWTRIKGIYTIDSSIGGTDYLYIFFGGGTGSSVDVYVRNVKIEKGNKATDWSPAPEDIDSSITIAQTTADNATTAANNAQSTANTANSRATYNYGTCSTAADTVAKVVTCSNFPSLYTGATIWVKFTNANTVASPTLNVNSTGAKAIYAYGSALTASSAYNWVAGSTVQFIYNGTQWEIADSSGLKKANSAQSTANTANTRATYHYATCSTDAGTAAKVATLSGFSLFTGATVSVRFNKGNTAASPTLNVNSTGAKSIVINGTASPTAAQAALSAYDTCIFTYDGTYWRLSGTDATVRTANNAQSTADAVTSTVNAGKSNWNSAYSWTSSNGTNMTNLRNMVLKWTNNAVSTSTYIQGGWIATNTITAEKIALGDFTNYASWKEKTASTCPFTSRGSAWTIDTSVYRSYTASYKYTCSDTSNNSSISGIKIPVNVGEKIYVEFYYKTDSGWTCTTSNSKLRFGKIDGSHLVSWTVNESAKTDWTKVSGVYTVTSSTGPYITVSIMMLGTVAGKSIWIDDIVIKKMATGELIVDGAISASKIASGAITAAKIAAGAVTADKISVSSLEAICAKIGGFNIGNTSIYNGTSALTSTIPGVYLGTDGIRNYKDANTYVDIKNGILTAKEANITGDITANGKIEVSNNGSVSTLSFDSGYVEIREGFDYVHGQLSGTHLSGISDYKYFKIDTAESLIVNSLLVDGDGSISSKNMVTNKLSADRIDSVNIGSSGIECDSFTVHDEIGMDNAKNIKMKNALGYYLSVLSMSTSNTLDIGQGGYTNSIGATNVYGYDIKMFVGSTGSETSFYPYYKAGDSISAAWYGAGFVVSTNKIYFTVPISRPIIGTPNVTVTSNNGLKVLQGGKWTHGSASGTYVKPSSYEASLGGNGDYVKVIATMSSTTDAITNEACGVIASIKIAFS